MAADNVPVWQPNPAEMSDRAAANSPDCASGVVRLKGCDKLLISVTENDSESSN
jgi:hypothetical protein